MKIADVMMATTKTVGMMFAAQVLSFGCLYGTGLFIANQQAGLQGATIGLLIIGSLLMINYATRRHEPEIRDLAVILLLTVQGMSGMLINLLAIDIIASTRLAPHFPYEDRVILAAIYSICAISLVIIELKRSSHPSTRTN